ncbi:unnamed protein product [Sphagnum tenellum]
MSSFQGSPRRASPLIRSLARRASKWVFGSMIPRPPWAVGSINMSHLTLARAGASLPPQMKLLTTPLTWQSELGTSYDPVSQDAKEASETFSRRVSEALELLFKAREAQAQGDFPVALGFFSQITEKAGDLALSEYARVGRALSLYEVGDRGEAILEMEDMSVSLKGYPEIHAALAAALYVDKHATVPAEQQFTIATLLDPRYRDLSWVRNSRHWPPSLMESLQKFILLR